MRILYPFAKRFIAGEDRATALKNIKSLYDQGFLCTVDVLGESVHTEEQAIAAKNEYLALLKDIETFHRPVDISAKVSALGMDISYDLCKKNVEELIDAANHHTVRFDMEGSDLTERTLKLGLELVQTRVEIAAAGVEYFVIRVVGIGQRQKIIALVREQNRAIVLRPALSPQPIDHQRIGAFTGRRVGLFLHRFGFDVADFSVRGVACLQRPRAGCEHEQRVNDRLQCDRIATTGVE